MPDFPFLAASREACRRLTQQHAKTFYFASHVLPKTKRRDAYAVYAFCRYVDDRIDLAPDAASRISAFASLEALLSSAYREHSLAGDEAADLKLDLPWFPAFRETVHRRSIPQSYFQDLLLGVEMDCGAVRLESWPELDRYCYHVASVVGLIMVHVLTEPSPELLEPARHLGTAMQLTNILRDLREDWDRDRLYLPREELTKFDLTENEIALQKVDDRFRAMMRFQIERARTYYRLAQPGIDALPNDGSRLTVRLMRRIYGAILDEIERADYRIFQRRAHVSFRRKVWLALTI